VIHDWAVMDWKQPALLWLLLIPGGLLLAYRASLRRVPRGAIHFPLTGAAIEAERRAGRVRRYLPTALFLLALTAAFIGAAGPVAPWPAATGWPVVIIIDVSRSMEENDIVPSRILATKTAAQDFVRGLPRTTKVALVSFGNYATLVVPLTADHRLVEEGIRNLTVQLRTQLGNGLVEGIRAVTGEQGASVPATPSDRPRAIAVLMSDGRASDGIPPLEAAQEAKMKGVRVYAVGVGTARDPRTFRSGYFGVLDEPTLRAIATETGGEYFRATEAGRLRQIYRYLARTIGWERKPQEVAAVAGGIALLCLAAAVAVRSRLAPIADVGAGVK
jgi:Ca-activated chloride channel family protein